MSRKDRVQVLGSTRLKKKGEGRERERERERERQRETERERERERERRRERERECMSHDFREPEWQLTLKVRKNKKTLKDV